MQFINISTFVPKVNDYIIGTSMLIKYIIFKLHNVHPVVDRHHKYR